MKLSKEKLSDESLYNQALELICDYFNEGIIPDDKQEWFHGVATVFGQWAKNIRDNTMIEYGNFDK